MASARLLLVDDDESVLSGLKAVLEAYEFDVTAASNVNEALQRIMSESFDVLLSDLHMPGPGDGLTVVSAMRHAHPHAVTIVLSAHPDMSRACAALVRQADEVILKPVKAASIVELIQRRLAEEPRAPAPRTLESVAAILEGETDSITRCWLTHMQSEPGDVREADAAITLGAAERCDHLPDALRDIVFRLRYPQPLGSKTLFSMAALQHGARRRRQGIGAATMVEEARALQLAVFAAIDANMHRIDLGELSAALMAIADEGNAQLQQALEGYENEQPTEARWGFR